MDNFQNLKNFTQGIKKAEFDFLAFPDNDNSGRIVKMTFRTGSFNRSIKKTLPTGKYF